MTDVRADKLALIGWLAGVEDAGVVAALNAVRREVTGADVGDAADAAAGVPVPPPLTEAELVARARRAEADVAAGRIYTPDEVAAMIEAAAAGGVGRVSVLTIEAGDVDAGELEGLRAFAEGTDGTAVSAVLRRLAGGGMYGGLSSGRDVAVVSREAVVSPAGAAELLGVSRAYVSVLVRTGRLPSARAGTRHRIAVADVEAFARQREGLREVRRLGAEIEGAGGGGE